MTRSENKCRRCCASVEPSPIMRCRSNCQKAVNGSSATSNRATSNRVKISMRTSVELGALLSDLRPRQRQHGGIASDFLLAFAAQDIAHEFPDLRVQRF